MSAIYHAHAVIDHYDRGLMKFECYAVTRYLARDGLTDAVFKYVLAHPQVAADLTTEERQDDSKVYDWVLEEVIQWAQFDIVVMGQGLLNGLAVLETLRNALDDRQRVELGGGLHLDVTREPEGVTMVMLGSDDSHLFTAPPIDFRSLRLKGVGELGEMEAWIVLTQFEWPEEDSEFQAFRDELETEEDVLRSLHQAIWFEDGFMLYLLSRDGEHLLWMDVYHRREFGEEGMEQFNINAEVRHIPRVLLQDRFATYDQDDEKKQKE